MTIANLTQHYSLGDSDFLGLPVMHHISNDGFWYAYRTSDFANNSTLAGNSIVPYQWDSALTIGSGSQLAGNSAAVELDGTIAFIDETHDGTSNRYHGGCIQHIGAGVNDITNITENNAFFFGHIGTWGDDGTQTGGLLEDDAFYWDRLYQTSAGGDWEFYQYHKHLPSNYAQFDDGRLVWDADGYVRSADKQYGYLITIRATSGGSSYNVPLARIHTPSIGGAHNSHNDVTLPSTAGVNYLAGGILKGSSNRFHAFYMDSSSTDGEWNVYSRTFTSSSGSFTPQVNYGSYDLATPTFVPYPGGNAQGEGIASQYPMRVSAGHTFGSYVYWPTIMKAQVIDFGDLVVTANGGNLYQLSGTDRQAPGTLDGVANHPTVKLKVGDTARWAFANSGDASTHPLYIKTNSNTNTTGQAAGASGHGTQFITFTPQTAGTYYYVCVVHSGMYGVIEVTDIDDTYDTQIWRVTDANTISPGTLERYNMPWNYRATPERPDLLITSVGTKLYVAGAGSLRGGADLYSAATLIDSTGALYDEGQICTNTIANELRVHGFKYNATNTKFYALLSGTQGTGTYSGKGLYSFDLAGGSFDGYDHLDYDVATGTYVTKGPNTAGHIMYTHSDASFTKKTTSEPEGITQGTSIMQYQIASPQFFNKTEVNTNYEEYYFQGIYLSDGRKALVGQIRENPQNTGLGGDLLLTIIDNENNDISYTYAAEGDDYITGIIEDVENNRLVLSGYAKGELTSKGSQGVHGWGRNLKENADSAEMEFTGLFKTEDHGFKTVGNSVRQKWPFLSKYDKDYNYKYSKYFSLGFDSDELHTVTPLSNGKDYIVSGWTKNGTNYKDGYMARIDSADNVIWSKRFGSGTNYNRFTTHAVVQNGGNDNIVAFLSNESIDDSTQTAGILSVINTQGDVTSAKLLQLTEGNFWFNKIKPGRPNTGEFLFAGSDVSNGYRGPSWGIGNINEADLLQYIRYHSWSTTAVSDNQGNNVIESEYNDIVLNRYDSDNSRYKVMVAGKREDTSLADNAGTTVPYTSYQHRSFAIAGSYDLRDSAGTWLSDTRWEKQYYSPTSGAYLEEINTLLSEDSSIREWWYNDADEHPNPGNHRTIALTSGLNLDSGGEQSFGMQRRTGTAILGINDSDGSLYFSNSLGHMGEDFINKDMVWDEKGLNFVFCGSSTSHSYGRDAILMRQMKDGFGTGVYHTSYSTSNAYYYDSNNLSSIDETILNNNSTEITSFTPFDTTLDVNNIATSLLDQTYYSTEYNGSYGANGLFTGFLAYIDLADLQTFLNSDQYAEDKNNGLNIHQANDIFKIFQLSTVGDATADDGNIFAYDVLKSSDGEYYYTGGQVSGNMAFTNTGLSGVYDYWLGQFNIETDEWRFWQNGSFEDEEIYAIEELRGSTPSNLVMSPTATNNGTVNGTVSWTPTTAGTYYYQCGNHSNMVGQITVTDVQGSNSTFNLNAGAVFTDALYWSISGTDRSTTHSSALNPTITIDTGDTLNISVSTTNSNHPFYIQTSPGISPKAGNIAFAGRTTGTLAGANQLIGGYDLFLGIFNPRTWSSDYYVNGSGFNDKVMNLHDINDTIPNTLALVYTSFGSVNGSAVFGSEDIGIITFDYSSDTWSQGFNTGSETSEEIEQNGKPSSRLPDGRIGVVCNTAGAFADDANTYGLKDMGLGIFDFDSDGNGNYKGWSKYQVGSGSSDFSYSVDNNGSTFLVTGYSEATWDRAVHGVFVEFDPEKGFLAKSAGS